MINETIKASIKINSLAERLQKAYILPTACAVFGVSILIGVLAERNGIKLGTFFESAQNTHNTITIHSPIISVWHAVLLIFLPWMIFTFTSAVYRATKTGTYANVETEGSIIAVPGYLMAFFIAVLVSFAITYGLVSDLNAKILLYNIAGAIWCFMLIASFISMCRQPLDVQNAAGGVSSRAITGKRSDTLLKISEYDVRHFIIIAAIIVIGGILFGYIGCYQFLTSDPLARGIKTLFAVCGIWLLLSWIIGNYRTRILQDPRGMKVSLLAIGKPIAIFFIIVSIFGFGSEMLQSTIYSTYINDALLAVILITTIICAFDLFFILNSLVTLSSNYISVARTEPVRESSKILGFEQKSDSIYKPLQRELSRFDIILGKIGKVEPAFGEWINFVGDVLLIKPSDTIKLESLSQWKTAVSILSVVVIVQGLAAAIVGMPILGHFIGLNVPSVDMLAGAGLGLVSLLIIIAMIIAAQRLFGLKPNIVASCTSVGLTFVPICAMAVILSLLPEQYSYPVAGIIYPAMLLLGVGYLSIILSPILIPNRNRIAAAVILIAATLIGYTGSYYATNLMHVAMLRQVHVPIIQVRDRLSDEVMGVYSSDVRSTVGQLQSVDMADVSAGDLIDHVIYARKVANRFYGIDGNPEALPSLRIRCEVSSNAGWMRDLYPQTHKLTANSKTPKEAAEIICRWVKSQMKCVEPTTFPFGEKFGQDPMTTLRGKRGDGVDVAVLMVAALRSAGVAAHIVSVYPDRFANGTYTLAEYFDGIDWQPCYPSMTLPIEPKADPKALVALSRWLENKKNPALYVLEGGIWRPYNTGGRDKPTEISFELLPGTYLATYTVKDICHSKICVVGKVQ